MTDTPDVLPAIVQRPTQAEVNYAIDGAKSLDGAICRDCRWFINKDNGGPSCHLIQLAPLDIHERGHCDRFEAAPTKELPPAVISDAVNEPPAFVDEPVVITPTPDGWTATVTVPDGVTTEAIPDGTVVVVDAFEPETIHIQHTVTDDSGKSITGYIKTKVAELFKRDDDPQASGIKVYGDRWVAWWSNAYEDREKEFFPAKAIDDYIARVDMGIVPFPELWVWHVPGSKHGRADWLGRIGNFAVASGTFDDSAAGRHAKAAYSKRGQRYQMSHGFFYDTAKKQDGAYHQFNTFELTTIPAKAKAAANSFTDFQGADLMSTLTPEKKAELEALLGKEAAEELIAKTEAKDKALVEFGVAYKDFVPVTDSAANVETEAAKEAVDAASKDFATLLVDLVGDHAHVSTQVAEAMKAVVAYKQATDATIAKQNETINALKQQLEDRPRRASTDEATELDNVRIEALKEEMTKQSKTIDKFWGTEVSTLE